MFQYSLKKERAFNSKQALCQVERHSTQECLIAVAGLLFGIAQPLHATAPMFQTLFESLVCPGRTFNLNFNGCQHNLMLSAQIKVFFDTLYRYIELKMSMCIQYHHAMII